jgi:hypothetical protein
MPINDQDATDCEDDEPLSRSEIRRLRRTARGRRQLANEVRAEAISRMCRVLRESDDDDTAVKAAVSVAAFERIDLKAEQIRRYSAREHRAERIEIVVRRIKGTMHGLPQLPAPWPGEGAE